MIKIKLFKEIEYNYILIDIWFPRGIFVYIDSIDKEFKLDNIKELEKLLSNYNKNSIIFLDGGGYSFCVRDMLYSLGITDVKFSEFNYDDFYDYCKNYIMIEKLFRK